MLPFDEGGDEDDGEEGEGGAEGVDEGFGKGGGFADVVWLEAEADGVGGFDDGAEHEGEGEDGDEEDWDLLYRSLVRGWLSRTGRFCTAALILALCAFNNINIARPITSIDATMYRMLYDAEH